MTRSHWPGMVAMLLALAPLPALAGASATANLLLLRFELVDLAPDDAVAPSLLFPVSDPFSTFLDASASSSSVAIPPPHTVSWQGEAWVPGAVIAGIAGYRADAAFKDIAASSAPGGTLRTHAEAGPSLGAPGLGTQALARAVLGGDGYRFSLSPKTRLLITGTVALQGLAVSSGAVYGAEEELAHALAFMRATTTADPDAPGVDAQVLGRSGNGPFQQRLLTTLSLAVENPGDAFLDGQFTALASAEAYAPVNRAIPEPSSAALLLLGGAGLAAFVRTNRRRRT